MIIERLRVIQCRPASGDQELLSAWAAQGVGFHFSSCLRSLLVFVDGAIPKGELAVEAEKPQMQNFHGREAYDFLLRVATGLESRIKGETEIFGQLKCAWRRFQEAAGLGVVGQLRPVMEKVFLDAKNVRHSHLQGIGGASYGSLARMLINPEPEDSVVIIGAGQLAVEVAGLFSRCQLAIWNGNKQRLQACRAQLKTEFLVDSAVVSDEGLDAALAAAKHVIICTPVVPAREERWRELRRPAHAQGGKTLHLGGVADATALWQGLTGFLSLTDVFNLSKDQDEVRSARVDRAIVACAVKAKERDLYQTLNLIHCWEDLVFSS